MDQPAQRPARPALPSHREYSEDATGLNSLPADVDAVDDLSALAASVAAPCVTKSADRTNTLAQTGEPFLRQTLGPLLLTGGFICLGLSAAWWMTDADSPYRRVSYALPIVLTLGGVTLLIAAVVNMVLIKRCLNRHRTAGSPSKLI